MQLNSKSYSHHDLLSPISSQHDPEISSSAQDQSTMDLPPPEQPSADDCLASVSKFDRSHYGKIGSDMQGMVMGHECSLEVSVYSCYVNVEVIS